ncbi:zinc finger protein 638-like [Lampris incognitus]|uniref:zinc finger protein 638-like n=1 Tax=Lampris incognitus TaxID=2546036 RepID=UPI0024B4A607|nr:zinc finger protein 638-like [Lampris incognitus]
MYHHHSQQQGPPQGFSNRPRPSHHQHPNQQQQPSRSADVLSQTLGFQFPRPTQLPDELESALAIRGSRDMDHRLLDHMNRSNQGSGPGMGQCSSESGGYSSSSIPLISDNQPGHQQGGDWSSYKHPSKLFTGPSHQAQRQPQNSYSGTGMQSWNTPVTDTPPQARGPHGGGTGSGGNSGGVDGQSLYTPESAGSILASFGLSNEDLEVLSHYPDDQLTPDTLPFILRDIQINKSNKNSAAPSSSSSNFPQSISRSIHNVPQSTSCSSPLERSHSPEVPSLLSVTQTAGKVIDYGHASRATDESSGRDTFKREPLSSERTVKMVYSPPPSPVPKHKAEVAERRMVRLEHTEPNKHGDLDYRRTSGDIHKSKRSPVREFPLSKPRRPDRDYRRDVPQRSTLSGTRSESSSLSRHPVSSSASKAQGSTKRLPTPTMISDFSAEPPKVYPHTCSLCHTQCDQAKDWIEHVNTVSHTAACRDLRNKYPDWKPNLKRRNTPDDSRTPWPAKGRSPSHSISRSLSWSPSPPPSKRRLGPHPHRPHESPYPPHHRLRHHHHGDHTHRSEPCPSDVHSPSRSHRGSSSSSSHQPERKAKESSGVSTSSSRSGLKRSHDDSSKSPVGSNSNSSSSATKPEQCPKAEPPQSSNKTPTKTGSSSSTKATKTAATTEPATFQTPKVQPSKKKKKAATPVSQAPVAASCQVSLTGIPKNASEQEVSDMVGAFGKFDNLVLTPGSEEEGEKDKVAEQKASLCMMKAEDAQALAQCTDLFIKDQQITASIITKPEGEKSLADTNKGKPSPQKSKSAADGRKQGNEADKKTGDEKGVVLIAAFPESGWSESDIIKLAQPFGTPSGIIIAEEIGKALVSLPTAEMAKEMVKVHSFIPAKIGDSELKITSLKSPISLRTPVALYNLLNRPLDPLEASAAAGWSSLLVISNVPDTPSGPTEVQKLVKRFGTVKNTLVLNNNTIICEMETAALALAVHKRFQKFPCIVQNSPLTFTRKADPKPTTQGKVIAAYVDSPKAPPANGKDSQETSLTAEEDLEPQDEGESVSEGKESDENNGEKAEEDEQTGEGKAGEDESEENNEVQQHEAAEEASDSAQANEPEADTDASKAETAAVKTAVKQPANNKTVPPAQGENAKSPEPEETKTCDDGETSAAKCADSTLPKVTQEMVDALREECRIRTTSRPNQTASTPDGKKEELKKENTGEEKEEGKEAQEGKKELAKKDEEEKKKQERKEREARKEKEVRERERKEKERRERERREREERVRRDRERREEERRERERRERRRTHREGSAGSRSSGRSEGSKRSSRKDGHGRSTTDAKDKKVEEEEEVDEFPFDFGDFVTVDEVGDVADLPSSPPPSVDTDMKEELKGAAEPPAVDEDSPVSVQEDTHMATTAPTIVATACSEPPPVTEQSEVLDSQFEVLDSQFEVLDSHSEVLDSHSDVQDSQPEVLESQSSPGSSFAALEASASLTLTSTPITTNPQATRSVEQTDSEPDATPSADTTATLALDSTPVAECLPTSAPADPEKPPEADPVSDAAPSSSTESPAKADMQEGNKETGRLDCSQEEEPTSVASEKLEEVKPTQDESKEKGTVEGQESEDESGKKQQIQTPTENESLLPFNPDNPVGMEFLVPKTGFFCKVCNRFFTGLQAAQISHCKSLKHYENLQKYLKTRKTANTTVNESS